MGIFYDRMQEDLKLKVYALSTQDTYLRCARRFVAFHMRPPTELGEKEIRAFLMHLLEEKKVGAANHKIHVAAIKFLFNTTLRRPEEVVHIPWPKVPRTLPDILSGDETINLLEAIDSIMHRAILMAAYGGGLRIKEACSLCAEDIDSKRGLIHVRHGKRGQDRYVMLSDLLLACLRHYWRSVRPAGAYLFPGRKADTHISDDAVRNALRKASNKLGITKRVTPHNLRHAFATHLLEDGCDIRVIQVLLGHGPIRSTARYTHVSAKHIGQVKSPLDTVGKQRRRASA